MLHNLETGLIMAIQEFVSNPARRGLIGQLQSLRAKPLDTDHCYDLVGQDASDCGCGLEVFEEGHVLSQIMR